MHEGLIVTLWFIVIVSHMYSVTRIFLYYGIFLYPTIEKSVEKCPMFVYTKFCTRFFNTTRYNNFSRKREPVSSEKKKERKEKIVKKKRCEPEYQRYTRNVTQ